MNTENQVLLTQNPSSYSLTNGIEYQQNGISVRLQDITYKIVIIAVGSGFYLLQTAGAEAVYQAYNAGVTSNYMNFLGPIACGVTVGLISDTHFSQDSMYTRTLKNLAFIATPATVAQQIFFSISCFNSPNISQCQTAMTSAAHIGATIFSLGSTALRKRVARIAPPAI